LYEAILRDYTGRTPEALDQTLIVTHLNLDRPVLNSLFHLPRETPGDLRKEQVMFPVLNTPTLLDGELRPLSPWYQTPAALALLATFLSLLPFFLSPPPS
ncbi:hypothetical protein, partial [Escherichia coli]|uniref:hypothetical protein n=1 Tax=Escherichia coli TaxID=562 RepID=UPI001BC83CA5